MLCTSYTEGQGITNCVTATIIDIECENFRTNRYLQTNFCPSYITIICDPRKILTQEYTTPFKGVARVYFFPEALAEFQHINCMILQI